MGFNENQTQTMQAVEPVVSIEKPELINGSHAVIQSLIAEGVETIFGYPGGAIMPVYDAFYDYRGKINHFRWRHEQGVGMARKVLHALRVK